LSHDTAKWASIEQNPWLNKAEKGQYTRGAKKKEKQHKVTAVGAIGGPRSPGVQKSCSSGQTVNKALTLQLSTKLIYVYGHNGDQHNRAYARCGNTLHSWLEVLISQSSLVYIN